MSQSRHHPTWAEIRAAYLSELEKDQAAWRFYQKLREEYAPVPRDRAS